MPDTGHDTPATSPRRTWIARRLAAAGVATPDADARVLVRDIPPEGLESAVSRRVSREPLQLVVGTVGFRYVDVVVRHGVFVPRPETEVLAGEAIARTPTGGVVVEPCTGTGVVAICLALEASPGLVHATDSSPSAVALARENAARLGAAVEVSQGDLLAPLPARLAGTVDVLVANPPYVTPEELIDCEPEVRDWDPRAALVPGPTGHEVSDRLLAAAPEWLAPAGWILLETGEARAEVTARRAREHGLRDVAIIDDLTGRPRIVVARAR